MATAVVHSVHIYDGQSSLITRLCGIVKSGLEIGNAVLIVATNDHRERLVSTLHDAGVDVRGAAREGRFQMYDAEETLATFMQDGLPDQKLFDFWVGNLLADGKKNSRGKDHALTVFGEMVSVLYDEGRKEAALQLEALWNKALNERVFHLHCAYPSDF